jgi:transposase-like protein
MDFTDLKAPNFFRILHLPKTMQKNTDPFELIPPYCPNPRCVFHQGTEAPFFIKNGFCKTDKPPFTNQRYKCRHCRQQFSANTFKLDFRRRKIDLHEKVLNWSMNGMSNNSVARQLKIAEGTVRNRLKVLAQQSLFFEKENYPKEIKENVAYDGFETFTHSQFSPCYINTAVGSDSLFIYHNTFSPLNRKGRMTSQQKIRNQELLEKHGPYPRDAVFEETLYIVKCLDDRAQGVKLFTDEQKAYLRAMKSSQVKLEHMTISSERRRDPSNPLFPINHLHMLYRHFFSSQQRETIAFQKHEAALLEKIQIMKIYRNFMNTKFVRKNNHDQRAHICSPAMYVGVAEKVLSFDEIFDKRRLKTQVKLDAKEEDFLSRSYPYSRQIIAGP